MLADLRLLPLWFLLIFYGLFGLVFGSFLNVVISRVPAGESLMTRSHCPKCGHPIRERDNVPLAGWILLHGRCRDCHEPISWRYPAIEALTMLAFVGVGIWQGGLTWMTPALLIFVCASIALAMTDIDTLRLPDEIVFPSTVLVGMALVAAAAGSGQWDSLLRGVLAGAIYTAGYAALWFLSAGRGLGFGDVKIAFMLGLMAGYLSWEAAAVSVFAAWLTGGIIAGIGMMTGRIKRGSHVPFGPFLIVGCWIGMVWGSVAAGLYLPLLHG